MRANLRINRIHTTDLQGKVGLGMGLQVFQLALCFLQIKLKFFIFLLVEIANLPCL